MRVLACALLVSLPLQARTLHVGSGQTYANLQPAATAAQAGDTILIHAGTYAGGQWIDGLQGSEAAPISILAAPGAAPVVDGGGEAWHFVDAAWVLVRGITFAHQTSNGVNADDGGTYATPTHHLTFDRCTWRDMSATGNNDQLKLSGVDSFTVRNCRFVNGSAGGSGIDMVGCHWGVFTLDTFENQGSNSIQAKGGSRYVRMERNLFIDGGERALNLGGSTGLQFFRPDTAHYEAADLEVYSNVFIRSYAPIAYVGCINTTVANNTFFKPEHWVIRILQETVDSRRFAPCGSNSFRNNIVYRGAVATDCNVGDSTAPQTFTFSNNLWYNYQSPGASAPRDLPVTDANSVVGQDPVFSDTAAGNLAILASSPAAGRGVSLSAPALDYLGLGFGSPRSIGAYEANPSAVAAPALRSPGRCPVVGIAGGLDLLGRTVSAYGYAVTMANMAAGVWLTSRQGPAIPLVRVR